MLVQVSIPLEIQKARLTERARVEQLLAKQTRTIRDAFASFIQETRSPRTLREIANLLDAGRIREAIGIVQTHVTALANVIPKVITNTGLAEVEAVASRITNPTRVRLTFDPSDYRVAALMRNDKLKFIQDFNSAQADTTRRALANSYARGTGTKEAAKAFKDSIGLSPYQQKAVENYRALLERQSPEALNRAIRDRRFDSSVERSIRDGEALSSDQIDRMVDRYQERYLQVRAETIARTEGTRITSIARHEALEQIVDQSGFERQDVRRTWHITRDKRTRDSHRPMEGQTVGIDEPFVSGNGVELMYPGDPSAPADEVIHCRCQATYSFA